MQKHKLAQIVSVATMPKRRKAKAGPSLLGGEPAAEPYLRVDPTSGAVSLQPAALPQVSAASSSVPRPSKSERKAAAGSTAGAAWGHMRAPALTEELKRELLLLKMRGVLDPKRFYRSSDIGKELPKFFHVGTLVEGAEDGRERLSKRERKASLLAELMSDDAVRKRARSQFQKVQAASNDGVRRTGPPNKRGVKAKSKRR